MTDTIARLGLQLEAIDLALEAACAEPNPGLRRRSLAVVSRAAASARQEYEAVAKERQPPLRLVGENVSATRPPRGGRTRTRAS